MTTKSPPLFTIYPVLEIITPAKRLYNLLSKAPMSFSSEEEPNPLLPNMTQDIFKHENGTFGPISAVPQTQTNPADSVDMLLKEINPESFDPSTSFTESLLAMASPVKPLNFPSHKSENPGRDYNSSSDTYVSDHGDHDGYNLDKSLSHEELVCPSPTKSIMKSHTGETGSPKKQVAFHNEEDLEELHLYSAHDETDNQTDNQITAERDLIAHAWSNVEQLNLQDERDSSTPPAPPPHSSGTITGLLGTEEKAVDDVNVSDLSEYRLNHKSFSNLSLNEKLGLFLNNPQFQTAQDDLDDHLQLLDQAREQETNVNIHQLSFDLNNTHRTIQNPLNALTRTEEVVLKSGGSSQSSLQSLMESNRYLEVNTVGNQSSGIMLNDGIKGFLDNMADLIIPATDAYHDDSSDVITFGSPRKETHEHNDSINHSYNLTEKSILSLLNSTSQLDLTGKEVKQDDHEEEKDLDQDLFHQVHSDHAQGEDRNIDQTEQEHKEQENSATIHLDLKQEESEFAIHKTELPAPTNSVSTTYLPLAKSESLNSIVKREPEQCIVKPEPREIQVKKESPQEDLGPASPFLEEVALPDIAVKRETEDSVESEEPAEIHVKQEQVEPQMDLQDAENEHVKREPEDPIKGFEHYDNDHLQVRSAENVSNDNESIDFELNDISLHMEETEILEVVYRDNNNYNVKFISPLDPKNSPSDEEKAEKTTDATAVATAEEEEEDNTTASKTMDSSTEKVKLKTVYVNNLQQEEGVSRETSSEVFEDTSEDPLGKMEVPSKLLARVMTLLGDNEEENSILANSSNIVPPSLLDPPSAYTKSPDFNYNSFEESLSAEHDPDTKKNDFISIWHSQQQKKKTFLKPSELSYRVSSILNYNTNLTPVESHRIPSSLNPRKFKEVNLVSKRIVSPGFEDLHVSGFLPEISQDSGLEGHFQSLLGGNENKSYAEENGRRKSWSSYNILSELDDQNVAEPAPVIPKRHSINVTLKPKKVTVIKETIPATQKKSKFYVPPFEIKRTDSVLSPKNKYNDIFDDGSFAKPTIKANGMKTLPSMDRDDVRRIMQMKQAMTQEEYYNLKQIGNKRAAVVQEHAPQSSHIPQVASIHCDSIMSHLSTKKPMQHVADELLITPVAIQSKDQLFSDAKVSPTAKPAVITELVRNDAFPDPDPELLSDVGQSPRNHSKPVTLPAFGSRNPFIKNLDSVEPPKTPTTEFTPEISKDVPTTPQKNTGPGSKKSPIKIHSPVKILKSGNSVTGVVLDNKRDKEFTGTELLNQKPRESKSPVNPLSTVSVPSNLEEPTIELNKGISDTQAGQTAASRNSSVVSSERGKLFFRVVGFKNINLPGIRDRNASFNIILDNGVHCIKTPSYKMDSPNVLIGKEFELTVGESLEFILTMKATYDKPKGTLVEVSERKVVKPKNKIRRMLGSKDVVTVTKYVPSTVRDDWEDKFATDGSFARCYVDLEQYEGQVLGKACSFNIKCFNEWASTSPGNAAAKCKPYVIGQLEVKMLFVPRSEPYEILPSSIKYAYERLDDLKNEKRANLSGYMYQEGGDSEAWKKRWFVLLGTSLVAHSEFSHKTRAKINLAKVAEVIYVDNENAQRSSSNYRNFSDILLMENAFKIRFANGEVIDFGAANKTEKLQWIKAIQEIVYRNKFRQQPWVKLMQRRNGHVLLLA